MFNQPMSPEDDTDSTRSDFTEEEMAEINARSAANLESLKTVIDVTPDQVISTKYRENITYNFKAECELIVTDGPGRYRKTVLDQDMRFVRANLNSDGYTFELAVGQQTDTYGDGNELRNIKYMYIPSAVVRRYGKLKLD